MTARPGTFTPVEAPMNNNKNIKPAFTASDISNVLLVAKRSIERRAVREQWPYTEETGRGGTRRLYGVDALPADVQAALAHSHVAEIAPEEIVATAADNRAEALAVVYESKPEKIKAKARAALAIAQDYHGLLQRGFDRAAVIAAVTKQHNVSPATVWRTVSAVKGQPDHLWLYVLCPQYAGRTARAEMPAEAWELLKADYLRREQPTAAACIFRLRKMAEARGWELPATRTLQRRLEQLPRVVKELQRKGPTAAKQLYPAQQRLKGALHALEIINGDGYKHNVWVKFPDGEIIRAKTWVWQDVYSSKIVAWRTDKTEHTDVIRLSFGDLVENYGIPEQVTLDNTLAAANKTMSGGVKHRFRFKVKEDEPLGVFALMNVRVSWATPGHGQAKPVERVFGVGGLGEYVDKAPELAGCWTGANPLEKPEYDGRTKHTTLEVLQRVLEREIADFNARVGRRGAMHNGRSFDALFNESYATALIRKPTEAQRRLWLLATEPVRANAKSGEITLDAGRVVGERTANRYWSPEMAEYAGRQVVARFDPARLYKGVHVYTLDGRYICFADCVEAAGFNDANAGREHSRARQTFTRAVKAQAVAETRMSVLEVAKAYEGTAHPTIPAADVPASKVVRGSFGDPIARPVPQAAPLSDEDRAAMEQLEREIETTPVKRVAQIDNPEFNYKRWNTLQARVAKGEQLTVEDATWHRAYQGSDEWSAMEKLAEDFPELKQA
jgi:putative transposase